MKLAYFKKPDSHLREILSKGAVAFALKIAGAGLAFLFQVAIARQLGASGAGVYFLALAFVIPVVTAVQLGMDNIVTRFVAAHASESDWRRVRGVMRHAIRIVLAVALAASATLFFFADMLAIKIFSKPDLAAPLKLMVLFVAPFSLMLIYAAALQGLKRSRDTMLMHSVLTPLFATAALIVLAPRLGTAGAILAYGIGIMFNLLFGFCMWQRASAGWLRTSPDFSARLLLSSSLPLFGASVVQQIMQVFPLLLLGMWADSAEVGVFSVAQRTAGLLSLVLIAANAIVAPKFAELYHQEDMAALGKVARYTTALVTVMALPGVILMLFAPEWLMGMYGADFRSGWPLLTIMALGELVNVATGAVGLVLVMTGNQRSFMMANLIAFGLNLALALALIPGYGGLGAATATAVSVAAVNLLRVHYVWRTMKVRVIPFLYRTAD
jgi:O-antigen/teichoic acid export membrane protein